MYHPTSSLLISFALILLLAQSAQAQEEPCSIPIGSFTTLPNDWKVSNGNPNGVTWTNQNIRVPSGATVYFDRNVTMTKCTIRMESNAKIIVQKDPLYSGYPILTTQQQTIFFGCTNMWNGIEFENGGGYNLGATEFRNATNGLIMKPGNLSSYFWVLSPLSFNPNNARIQGCTFRKNFISITVHHDVLSGNFLFLPAIFSDNSFVSDGNNLLSAERANASISFKNCNLGIVGGTNNTFDQTGSGVLAENSGVIVAGGQYKNMHPVGGGTRGYGVWGKDASLFLQKINFDNVWDMVFSNYARFLTVDQCSLTMGLYSGIRVSNTNTFKPLISITKNVMAFQRVPANAIKVVRSPGFDIAQTQNLIEDNQITVTGNHAQTTKLIDITAPDGGTDNFPIRRCTLTVESGTSLSNTSACHGIYLSSQYASGYEVDANRLYYNANNGPTGVSDNLGITFQKVIGQRNKVTANEVYAKLFPNPAQEEGASWMKCAYHLESSPHLDVCENTGNNTYRLFHLAGDLNYCDFAKNNIQTHWYGVICLKYGGSYNTFMGQQKWHENTWLTSANSYVKYSAYHQDFPTAVDQDDNFFKVDPDFPTHMPPGSTLNPPKVKPSNWFSQVNPNPLNDDVENSECVDWGFTQPEPRLGGWDSKVIDNTYPFESGVQTWDMQRELLYKLLEYPEELSTGTEVQTWYDTKSNTSPWMFARTELMYFNAFKIPTTDQTALDNARNTLATKLKELVFLDSLQNANPSEDAMLRQQQSDKAAEVVTAQTNFAYLAQQANNTVQAALSTVETYLNNLPTTQVWETNRKTLLYFWIKQAQGYDLTSTELNTVRSIANQCPLQGGLAVREIPLLLPDSEAYEYAREDYWENCVDSVQERTGFQRLIPVANNTLSVYPNPANNQVTFFLAHPAEAEWTLTDIAGRVWSDGKISSEQPSFTVTTGGIPAGVYFCIVRTSDGTLLNQKIAVQH